ncbi:MBL fold metallo-hydrolase [Solimonas flava]|uniref:MBL fold metallo-hydrolase n=1 Tax=Solimonas flava TaxID=415849 RepID=UPI001378D7E4|nr:MBL fold metallo-hydrolase [Solimonas flava]
MKTPTMLQVLRTFILSVTALLMVSATQVALAQEATPNVDAGVDRLIFLGTAGGPMARVKRGQPATLLVVDGKSYLIDAGAGTVDKIAKAGIDPQTVRDIFITHHHLDHTAGLEPLISLDWIGRNLRTRQSTPHINIYGPPGTESLLSYSLQYLSISERIFQSMGSDQMAPSDSIFFARNVAAGKPFFDDGKVTVLAVENTHYHFKPEEAAYKAGDKSYSYRFETPSGSIVFTGDTGPSPAVTELAKGADVLVSEVISLDQTRVLWKKNFNVAMPDDVAYHMAQEHLTPEEVGKMAQQAGVKMVILNHLVPALDSYDGTAAYSEGVKKFYSGPVVVSKDLWEYNLYKDGKR